MFLESTPLAVGFGSLLHFCAFVELTFLVVVFLAFSAAAECTAESAGGDEG